MPHPTLRRRKNNLNVQSTLKDTVAPSKSIIFSKLDKKTKDDNEKRNSENVQSIKTRSTLNYQFIDGVLPGFADPCNVPNMTWPYSPYCQSYYLQFNDSSYPFPPGPGSTILMGYSALTNMNQEQEYAQMVWNCINNDATKKMFQTYITRNIYSLYEIVGINMDCFGGTDFSVDAIDYTPPQITMGGDDIAYSISLSYAGDTICGADIMDFSLTWPYDNCIQNIQFPTPPAPPLIPEIAKNALLASSICCSGLLFAFAYKCYTWHKQGNKRFPSPRMVR